MSRRSTKLLFGAPWCPSWGTSSVSSAFRCTYACRCRFDGTSRHGVRLHLLIAASRTLAVADDDTKNVGRAQSSTRHGPLTRERAVPRPSPHFTRFTRDRDNAGARHGSVAAMGRADGYEHGGRLGFLVSGVVSMAHSRCVRNREHPVTVRAPEETDIVHHPDPSEARGFTEGTPGWWLQEQAEASLVGGLSHL
jgi:hypothetical protein